MDEKLEHILNALIKKYKDIKKISNWKVINSLSRLDQINEVINRRETILNDIKDISPSINVNPTELNDKLQKKYNRLKALVSEIYDLDKLMMDKINKRMNEIKEELREKSIFRTQAIPGYMKQKYALS